MMNLEKRLLAAKALGWKNVEAGVGKNSDLILGDELINDSYFVADCVFPKMADTTADSIIKLKQRALDAEKEVARLTGCLKKANAGFEEFERKYYLEQQAKDLAEQRARELEGYVQHKPSCGLFVGQICDCGLDALKSKLTKVHNREWNK